MTIAIKHAFTSAKADGPDPTLIQPSNWNASHVLTQATGYFLGKVSAGAGATEEVSPAAAQTLLGLASAAYVTASSLATNTQIAAATDTDFADGDFLTAVQVSGGALIKRSWLNTKALLLTAFANLFVPTGTVLNYAGASAPGGYLFANGQAVSRTTYAGLFALISNTYGNGDGSTTFNLPDLRGRVAAGLDNIGGIGAANRLTGSASGGVNANTLGATGGEQAHVQTQAEMAAHSHTISSTAFGSSTATGGFSIPSNVAGNTGTTGSGNAANVVQPTIALNVIIKT